VIDEILQRLNLPKGAYLVGGCVRDHLLDGSFGEDIDIVVDGDAAALVSALWAEKRVDAPPEFYPRFGTALVRVDGLHIEFASARKESYDQTSRKPDTHRATLEEDMLRRDFTVNALMMDPHDRQIIDLLGAGLSDLHNKILRTPVAPDQTFFDDPLRMLRAVRFKHRLGFEFADGLAESIRSHADRLEIISADRIRDELTKMLLHPTADDALRDLLDLGLLVKFAPELAALKGVEQGRHHTVDAWDHTLKVVKAAWSSDLVLTLAALTHDIGKPQTRSVGKDGRTHFFGHERVGAKIAADTLTRLNFGRSMAGTVAQLVRLHMRLGKQDVCTPKALRRLAKEAGEDLPRLLDLMEADGKGGKATAPRVDIPWVREQFEAVLAKTPLESLKSPLTGDEIIAEFSLDQGPKVGRLMEKLEKQVIEGKLDPFDKSAAIEAARRLIGS
jgi:putative nucleotidyltransferase with HDIG domain